jgi:hypothetical protein
MTHRIRIAAAMLCAFLIASQAGGTSWAGPSERQPADVKLKLGEARHYARVGAGYLAGALAHPDKPRIGDCATLRGRLLWACPATVEGADTRCTVTVWVWGSKTADRYYEFHGLRCTSR